MKHILCSLSVLSVFSCKQPADQSTASKTAEPGELKADFTLVFASCSDQDREQPLWKPIIANEPELFIWGGDNIYADTDDMDKKQADYAKVKANADYQELAASAEITGTWDDHDYGKNDAGAEWGLKSEAQQLFLDFLDVPSNDVRREQKGVYTSQHYKTSKGSIKLILLDTRTFRDSLKPSEHPSWRYNPWPEDHNGGLLGAAQWEWLEGELKDDQAQFTVIVSSIQVLNSEHGWEKWANFPSEATRLNKLLAEAKAKNILILSGDRHMAEVSVAQIQGLNYPLIDFTSSGLTHTWIDGATEGNPHRVSNVVKQLNFGVLRFHFDEGKIVFQIRGRDNFLYEEFVQVY